MRNRSNLLVLLGIAFFVVGGIIVYVVTNGDDGGGGSAAVNQTTVVVATHDIANGAKADDEIKGRIVAANAEAVDAALARCKAVQP